MLRRVIGFAAVLAVSACGGSDVPIDRARSILDDDARFETSLKAGDALAKIGGVLLEAGKECDGDGCGALLSASAYAQILAVRVLDCTAPGRVKIRAAMRAELDLVDDAGGDDVPEPPDPPRCR